MEIYQDCNIFNNGAFDEFAVKNNRAENTIVLEAGQPLIFGAERDKALGLKDEEFTRVTATEANLYQHNPSSFLDAMRLTRLNFPAFPVPLGIYYQKPREVFALGQGFKKTVKDLPALFRAKASWSGA